MKSHFLFHLITSCWIVSAGCAVGPSYEPGYFNTAAITTLAMNTNRTAPVAPATEECDGSGYITHGDGHKTPCPGCAKCKKSASPDRCTNPACDCMDCKCDPCKCKAKFIPTAAAMIPLDTEWQSCKVKLTDGTAASGYRCFKDGTEWLQLNGVRYYHRDGQYHRYHEPATAGSCSEGSCSAGGCSSGSCGSGSGFRLFGRRR